MKISKQVRRILKQRFKNHRHMLANMFNDRLWFNTLCEEFIKTGKIQ